MLRDKWIAWQRGERRASAGPEAFIDTGKTVGEGAPSLTL